MSLYDVIAAGHRGQCFGLLARRFMIGEQQAALAVRHLLPVLLPSFEAWASAPGGLPAFLDAMNRGGYEKSLSSPAVFTNHFERDRGIQLLLQFRAAREIDGGDITQAVDGSGVTHRVLVQMLPYVALLLMAGLRATTEAPFRDILARRLGANRIRSPNPFGELADLIDWESKGQHGGMLAGVLDALFGRRGSSPAPRLGAMAGSASASPG